MAADLELLQGKWFVAALEVDGQPTPSGMLSDARIEVKGDRFTSSGMGAEYAGTLTLSTSGKSRQIDMTFDTGPEAGNVNRGIYELKDGAWKLCLATLGDARPKSFATKAGSGHALEVLQRTRPKAVKKAAKAAAMPPATGASTIFEGEWRLVSGRMNGAAMDDSTVQWVKRVTQGNVTTVLAGPQTMLKVEFSFDGSPSTGAIDYLNLYGSNKGKKQLGIYEFEGDLLKFCVAAPGAVRPGEFQSVKGDQRTLTSWTRL
jgi:uncharacterized protein (TIGR03067 family)